MDIFQSIIAGRLVFVLGIVNLSAAGLILLSCRCIPGWKVTGNLMKYPAYQKFFRYHCYIWWVFWPSVVVHAVFAIAYFAVPF